MRVGEVRVTDLNDLVDAFYVASVGKRIEVEVLRGIEKLTMKLTPGDVPKTVVRPDPGSLNKLGAGRKR